MKKTIWGLVLFMMMAASGMACNLSSMTLCGITPGGSLLPGYPLDSTICINLCVGYGRTGLVTGADGNTREFAFRFYHRDTVDSAIRAFIPTSVTSGRGFSNCTMPGYSLGPFDPPLTVTYFVMYVDPGYYGLPPCVAQPFACINSTAQCGNVSQQCINYYFQVPKVPDSVRVFGIEGESNLMAGCTMDPDMGSVLRMGAPLSGVMGHLTGTEVNRTIQLRWNTVTESNMDFFVVQRLNEHAEFDPIGQVQAFGNSEVEQTYKFVDMAPMAGSNTYRLLVLDREGNSDYSQVVTVRFGAPSGLEWGAIGPNPTRDHVRMAFYSDRVETLNLSLYDAQGKAVMTKLITSKVGANEIDLNLVEVRSGAYFVSLNGSDRKLLHRIVRVD
ncbi:MAG: T9SS type A sorting domain-containing protein [Bacteroidia bacterium]